MLQFLKDCVKVSNNADSLSIFGNSGKSDTRCCGWDSHGPHDRRKKRWNTVLEVRPFIRNVETHVVCQLTIAQNLAA